MKSENLTEDDLKTLQRATDLLCAITVNSLFNAYAIENVIFGNLKTGDSIPYDKFIEDLQLNAWQVYSVRNCIEGAAIGEDGTILEKEIDFFEKECFIFHMNYVFESATYKKKKDDDKNGLHAFTKEGLNDYIMRLYPLFKEILATEAEYDFFELASPFPDRFSQTSCYEKIAKFLVTVITRGHRQGGFVDRYVKNLPYMPYYVKRLLKVKNGRWLLVNSDLESLDFRLAVLSAIHFMNAEHTQLFELKARKWAEKITNV